MIITKKIRLSWLCVWGIVCVSVLWMTEVTSISPFYLCVIPISIYSLYCNYHVKEYTATTRFVYLFSFLCFIYFLLQILFSKSTLHNNLVLGFVLLYYFFADSVLYCITEKTDLEKIVKSLVVVTIIYLFFDFIKRYKQIDYGNIPTWIKARPSYMFYLLKTKGLHGDSNNTGAIGLPVLCLAYFYKTIVRKEKRFYFITSILLFIAILGTFSRAALISFVFLILFYNFYYKRNTYFRFFAVFFACACFAVFLYFLLQDPSFHSKLEIFNGTFLYIKNQTNIESILWGLGGNESSFVLGRYAHNPISVYLIEYGLLGFMLYFTLFFLIIIDVGPFSIFIILPYFMMSLSFSPLHVSFLFAVLALIKHTKRCNKLNFVI